MEEIKGIKLDQVNGVGAISDNQSVDYLGFIKYMTPNQFFRLSFVNESTNKEIALCEELMQQNGSASPFLMVELVTDQFDETKWQVKDHGGKNRMSVFKKLAGSDVKIPVHIFPTNIKSSDIELKMESYDFLPETKKYEKTYKPILEKYHRVKERKKQLEEERKLKKLENELKIEEPVKIEPEVIEENKSVYKMLMDEIL